MIQKAGNAERINTRKKTTSALKKAENRQKEIDRLFMRMYEDRADKKITERNFVMLSSKYQKEQVEFVRLAPVILMGAVVGIFLTRKQA